MGSLIGALIGLLKVVVLFVVVFGVIRWASAHPAQWTALVNQAVTSLIRVLSWLFTWIANQIPSS